MALLEIIYSVFVFICKFFAVYFAYIAVFCILGKKKELKPNKKMKFAAIIAARNEENCIENIIGSLKLQDYPQELLDIFVVPNNCTDNTARVSQNAGANILTAPNYVFNKGLALQFAMDKLKEDYDVFVVFDADNELNAHFISSMNKTLCNGYNIVKSRILAKNRKDSWVATCYDIHFCTANQFLNRARVRIGLSARVIGTGFAVTTEFIKKIGGFNTKTITEDAEFYAICASNGEKIGFCENAIVYDEEPIDFKTSLIQRKRWMSGIMQVTIVKLKDLVKALTHKNSFCCSLDTLLQFIFCYVQALMPFMLISMFLLNPQSFLNDVMLLALKGYLCVFVTGILVLALEKRLLYSPKFILGLILYPIFVFSFIPVETISLFKKTVTWKETKHTGLKMDCSKQLGLVKEHEEEFQCN